MVVTQIRSPLEAVNIAKVTIPARGYSVDYRSYIKYECDKAKEAYKDGVMNIIALYNSCSVNRSLCPETLRYVGLHSPMGKRYDDGKCYYDYATVKDAFDKSDRE